MKKSTELATGISDYDEIAIILDNLLEDSLVDNTPNINTLDSNNTPVYSCSILLDFFTSKYFIHDCRSVLPSINMIGLEINRNADKG